MMARLFYWCGLAIAFVCGMAALTILTAIGIDQLPDSEAWTAVYFAVFGGLGWSNEAIRRLVEIG
jgi:hypothetical protein